MDGEIDLELYTISIIRLNTAFEKLENSNNAEDVKNDFKESCDDLKRLYNDIVRDLNENEINFNEYYLFFENGKNTFPQYIESLKNIDNDELDDDIKCLINVFSNFSKISEGFSQRM